MYATRASAPSHSPAKRINRREGFYYVWGASLLLLLVGVIAALLWFGLPQLERSVYDVVDSALIPPEGSPAYFRDEDIWLAHFDHQLIALYNRDTYLRCRVTWLGFENRFVDPCHGSKFRIDGTYIEGPSTRNMDRYRMTLTFADGTTATSNATGDPILLNGREIARLEVDTSRVILGAPHNLEYEWEYLRFSLPDHLR